MSFHNNLLFKPASFRRLLLNKKEVKCLYKLYIWLFLREQLKFSTDETNKFAIFFLNVRKAFMLWSKEARKSKIFYYFYIKFVQNWIKKPEIDFPLLNNRYKYFNVHPQRLRLQRRLYVNYTVFIIFMIPCTSVNL